ncbi:hypothetical protein QFZ80_003128 [Paenibacillus sp. V4I7]|nr:hypothetical protein [Paenibacillus sp. V4I7]
MEVASPNSFHMLHVFSTMLLAIFTPMSQRVKRPFIPSSHLSKGWRAVFLTERVGALLRNISRYSVLSLSSCEYTNLSEIWSSFKLPLQRFYLGCRLPDCVQSQLKVEPTFRITSWGNRRRVTNAPLQVSILKTCLSSGNTVSTQRWI